MLPPSSYITIRVSFTRFKKEGIFFRFRFRFLCLFGTNCTELRIEENGVPHRSAGDWRRWEDNLIPLLLGIRAPGNKLAIWGGSIRDLSPVLRWRGRSLCRSPIAVEGWRRRGSRQLAKVAEWVRLVAADDFVKLVEDIL